MPDAQDKLQWNAAVRTETLDLVAQIWNSYIERVDTLPVLPPANAEDLRRLSDWDFETPIAPELAVRFISAGLERGQLHTSQSAYFGVFNPPPSAAGVIADTLASAFNPQLASYPSAGFPIEVERRLLQEFARWFGWSDWEGVFTGGGTEANHTALLTALNQHFPAYATEGARGLPGTPRIYVSEETHHSVVKSARVCGLGDKSVREVPTLDDHTVNLQALAETVRADRAAGDMPFFTVSSVGTTSSGTIDAVSEIAEFAKREKLWHHVDAAWGGAACALPEFDRLRRSIGLADSVTLDAHKWFAVPMTAGIHLNRHAGALESTFRVGNTHYMPRSSAESHQMQPYAESMAWSRRFVGLRLWMTLACAGWEGYREIFRHQIRMGNLLREKLVAAKWRLRNHTPLPVVCFDDAKVAPQSSAEVYEQITRKVAASGRTWLTTTRLAGQIPVLRAGIANFRTEAKDLDVLIEALETARP